MGDFIYDNFGKICIISIVLLLSLLFYLTEKDCEIKANGMNLSHEWSFVSGCRINVDGKLIPLRNYRYNANFKHEI